jgi:hypothetical protein
VVYFSHTLRSRIVEESTKVLVLGTMQNTFD